MVSISGGILDDRFGDIKVGEFFIDDCWEVHVKIPTVVTEGSYKNAFSFTENKLFNFSDSEYVQRMNCHIDLKTP